MNQTSLEQQYTLKYKKPIILLSILSLGFTILGQIWRFIAPVSLWDGYNFRSPVVAELIFVVLDIAPCVLLAIYVLKSYKEFKTTKLIPIILGIEAVCKLYIFLIGVNAHPVDLIFVLYGVYSINLFTSSVLYISNILIFITFSLATIEALKKSSKKVFLIVATIAGLITEFGYLIHYSKDIFWFARGSSPYYILPSILGATSVLGAITFYVALLLLVAGNRVPSIIPIFSEKKMKKMSPEQKLKYLKNKFERGLITEEEYQAQRTEIISKL